MDHFYNKIDSENWFGYEKLYSDMVNKFDNNSHFVEVGVWKGMSTCFMGVEIINSGKKIKFDCVDTWEFISTSEEIKEDQFINLYDTFLKNVAPIKDKINIIRSISWEAAAKYKDESIDFIFIDAGHDYTSVTKDISSWYSKVRKGGIIAGHDYYSATGVHSAVNEYFKNKTITQSGDCWIHEKY